MSLEDQPRTAMERLHIARRATDLTFDANRKRHIDYVAAAGVAAGRSSKIGAALMQLHERRQSSLEYVLGAVVDLVRGRNLKCGWRLNMDKVWKVAEIALAHHLDPTCKHCKGVAYKLMPGTRIKSSIACEHCHGSGEHPLPRKLREPIEYVLSELQRADSDTSKAVREAVG